MGVGIQHVNSPLPPSLHLFDANVLWARSYGLAHDFAEAHSAKGIAKPVYRIGQSLRSSFSLRGNQILQKNQQQQPNRHLNNMELQRT